MVTEADQTSLAVYNIDTLHLLKSVALPRASPSLLMVRAGMLYALGISPVGTFIEQRDLASLHIRRVAYLGGDLVGNPVYDMGTHRFLIGTDRIPVTSNASTLYLIDGMSLRVLRRVTLPDFIWSIVASTGGNQAFVWPTGSKESYAVSLAGSGGTRTYQLGYATSIGAVDTQRGILFTITFGTTTRRGTVGLVSMLNGQTIDTVTVGIEPRSVTYDPQSGYLFVENAGSTTKPATITVLRLVK